MREEDSFFDIAVVPQLYTYPGDMNARIRYESMSSRPVQGTDLERAAAMAHRSYSEVFKKVKNQIKNPLSDKQPVMLLHASSLGVTENGQYVLTDGEGTRLLLEDIPSVPQGTVGLLPFLPAGAREDCTVMVMFEHDLDQGRLRAQPLSVLMDEEVIRLLY